MCCWHCEARDKNVPINVRGEQSKYKKVETPLFVRYMRKLVENGLWCKLNLRL